MPKVSVVTTVYNGESHLEQVTETVAGQEYDSFEWILVDDGSDDDSLRIMEDTASTHDFVELYAPGRMGRCEALNFAIRKAAGEYIAIQDVDDTSHKNRLSVQADYLDAHPLVGAAGGFATIRNEMRGDEYLWRPPSEHDELRDTLSRYVPIVHTLSMFRKAAWADAGGYPTPDGAETNTYREAADRGLEDLVLWIEMVAADWKLGNVETPLGVHHIYEESSWYKKNSYVRRQKTLAKVQYTAIQRLDLAKQNLIFIPARFAYSVAPLSVKTFTRKCQQRLSER